LGINQDEDKVWKVEDIEDFRAEKMKAVQEENDNYANIQKDLDAEIEKAKAKAAKRNAKAKAKREKANAKADEGIA
jgi:hypothetical protein